MASSAAKTPSAYLKELPADRRAEIATVRDVVLAHLPKGFVEEMGFGMINFVVPLSRYPETYNKQPLMYAALAAQKNFNALYLMGIWDDPATEAKLVKAFKDAGHKLDKGKSCIRFQSAKAMPLTAIGEIIGRMDAEAWIVRYEATRSTTATKQAAKKSSAQKPAPKKAAPKKAAPKKTAPKRAVKKAAAKKAAPTKKRA